jgi:hypothetical protein
MDHQVRKIEIVETGADYMETVAEKWLDENEDMDLFKAQEWAESEGYTVMDRDQGGCPEILFKSDVTIYIVTVFP